MPKGKVIDLIQSLGIFGSHNHFFGPFDVYLVDSPRKIIRTTFVNHRFDFSKAYSKFIKELTIIDVISLVLSYVHFSQMHASVYDKLLRVLKTFDSCGLILTERSGLCSLNLL